MKNVDQSDSNDIPPIPSHSNLITSNLKSIKERNQEHIKSQNGNKTSNLEDDKEKQSSNLNPDKSSISHPKVIDILDNQLEQLADHLSKCQKASLSPSCPKKLETDDNKPTIQLINTNYKSPIFNLSKPHSKNIPANVCTSVNSPIFSKSSQRVENTGKQSTDCVSKDNDLHIKFDNKFKTTEPSTSPKYECLDLEKDEPLKMENTNQLHKPLIDGLPSRLKPSVMNNTERIINAVKQTDQSVNSNDKEDSVEDSSSRKTSSSSNGSNSTSDSSSSFSSHNLKTLPENPDLSNNGQSLHAKYKTSNNDSTANNKSLLWQDDPGQLLNAWLGELDSLQKDLNSLDSLDGNTHRNISNNYQKNHLNGNFRSAGAANTSQSSRESSMTPVHMRRMSTPRVESPRLDSYRMSLINLEETLDHDLDAILGELDALENNFGDGDPDVSRDSDTSSKASKASSTISTPSTVVQVVRPSTAAIPSKINPYSGTTHDRTNVSQLVNTPKNTLKGISSGPTITSSHATILNTTISPEYLKMSSKMQHSVNENTAKAIPSEPEYITAECVRQKKMANAASLAAAQKINSFSINNNNHGNPGSRTESPDNDSAFCENISSNSGNGSNGCTDSSSSKLGILRKETKPAIHPPILEENNEYETLKPTSAAIEKAEKIRLAIEKIKEASIKKIFIKVFGEDGSAKSLLVDERMSVSQVCRMLADKNHVKRDTCWGLVELLPELHMERAYEDHELLVENLLMWKADSKNTLWFIKRPEVFDLFNRPEMYLLGETSSQIGHELDDRARAELVEEYFSSTGVGAPEVEGTLWLKAESKKSWKRFHFVLRTSGLYYAPKAPVTAGTPIGSKGNKRSSIGHRSSTKGLVCLARFDGCNQVYYGVKWQAKFKAPTRHCFAVKHPQIQAKNPKYIRYLAADTEGELNKWVTGIRIAKYGKTLYENYRGIIEQQAHDDIDQIAASSRLSVHDPKSNPAAQGFGGPHVLPQPISNHRIIHSGHQNKGNMRPIILADKGKSHGSSLSSQTTHFPKQKHNNFDKSTADNVDGISCEESASILTPNSNENSSFDSALQMSDDFYSSSTPEWKENDQDNIHTLREISDFKQNSQTLKSIASISQASVSSGSISDKNTEHGFNCDSPEGGTIKKKPNHQAAPSALKSSSNSNKITSIVNGTQADTNLYSNKLQKGQCIKTTDGILNHNPPKQVKGVRFKESFIAIPRPPSDVFVDEVYDNDTISRHKYTDNERSNLWDDKIIQPNSNLKKNVNGSGTKDNINQGIVASALKSGTGINNNIASNREIADQVKLRKNTRTPLQRRYSNESLISNNSVMMHTGTLIQANAIDDLALNQPQYPNKTGVHNVSVPSQPDRPAPVLKPAVGRKPSLDRSSIFQIRKQQSLAQQKPSSEATNSTDGSLRPTYEDTLKKCQSLTRHHSSPPSPNPSMNGVRTQGNEKAIVTRQTSCPTTSLSMPNSPGMKYTTLENNLIHLGASPILNKRLPSPPKSPAIPPKPDIAMLKQGYTNRNIKDDGNTKNYDAVTHLPPSGNNSQLSQKALETPQTKTSISLSPHNSSSPGYSHLPNANAATSTVIPPLNNRQHQLNQAFLNDLHLAMSAKLASQDAKGLPSVGENHNNHQKIVNASVNNWLMNQTSLNNATRPSNNSMECESPPFPVNRFSNGEYDNIQPNHLIKPSGVAKAVKILPKLSTNKHDNSGIQVGTSRLPIVNSNQRVKKMAPPPPPLSKRTKDNETSYSNWKRS